MGHAATVVLRNGSTQTGVLHSAATDYVSLTVGSGIHSFKAHEIAQVIQREPADLEDSEKQTCLAQIDVSFKGLGSPKEGQRLVSVTVTNKSRYDFKGKVQLKCFDRDGDTTGKAEMDLAQGQGLGAGQSATTAVIFQTFRWVAEVTRSVEGEFYRRVADVTPISGSTSSRPASPSPAQPKAASLSPSQPKPSAPVPTPVELGEAMGARSIEIKGSTPRTKERKQREAISAAHALAEQEERDRAKAEYERRAPASIDLKKFYALQEGMTYAQVRSILGCDGVIQSSSAIAGIRTQMLYWDVGLFKGMSLVFQNGRLVLKSQVGLQ
jgi:hypothetical protein